MNSPRPVTACEALMARGEPFRGRVARTVHLVPVGEVRHLRTADNGRVAGYREDGDLQMACGRGGQVRVFRLHKEAGADAAPA